MSTFVNLVASNGYPQQAEHQLADQEEDDIDMSLADETISMSSMNGMEIKSTPGSPPLVTFGKLMTLKSIAGKWKKKAVNKRPALNLAFSDSPVPLVDECHSMHWTKRRCVPLKDYHDEARAMKDISKFLENPVVLFEKRATRWEEIAREMLKKLKVLRPSLNLNIELAAECLVNDSGDLSIPEVVQGLLYDKRNEIVCDEGFITVLGSTAAVLETQTSFCVLHKPVNLGPTMTEIKLICLVLSPLKNKQTKSAIEVGRTYTTLLADMDLRRKLITCSDPAEFATLVKEECSGLHEKHTKKYLKEKEETAQENAPEAKMSATRKFFHDIMPPGKLLVKDIKRRSKHYLSDYTDGLDSLDSIKKYITSIVFLYFSLLLPVIAFGVLNSDNTHQQIDTRKGILAQAFGGLLYAIFAGQPLSVVQTTIPIVLFTKLIYSFSDTFNVDFLTFYMLVGVWNALFLIVYAITGVSKIMAYCSRSTEEIVGIFISIAFVVDSIKYVIKQFNKYWCFDKGADSYCDASVALAVFVIVFGTLFIGLQIYNFKFSPYLSPQKRSMVAEYALPFSVIVMSFIGSYGMDSLKLGTFTDNEIDPPYTPFAYTPTKFSGCGTDNSNGKRAADSCQAINFASFITTAALGFIVSLLFFVEGNVASSMVNNPHNKLKKGSAYHLDMLVTALINLFLSIFGLPWMHACLPHSPMHVRSLADIEEKVEHGYVKEIVVSVRETRLTTLIAHILIFVSILMIPKPLEYIPTPALYGILLFISISSLGEFQLWERVLLLFMEQNLYPPLHYIRKVPQKVVHCFTALQLLQLAFLCGISFSGFSYLKMLFPFVIFALIPIRKFLIPKFITDDHLEALDGSH